MNLNDTQRNIIKILFVEKESSRSLLAKRLSLTNAALTLSMKPLLEEKIVLENKNDAQKVGRKELKLFLNPDYGCFLGIDIKKHNIYYSLMDFSSSLIQVVNSKDISLSDFAKTVKTKILAIGITMRGTSSNKALESNYPDLYKSILDFSLPFFIINNVDCLADVYSLYHKEDKNFLLIKYGPGVGSSIYVNGISLGNQSELGHTYYQEKTVEETISYMSVIKKDVNEEEGTEILLNDDKKADEVIHVLSFALLNADSLLSLQKIILSGALLSNDIIIEKMKKEIHNLNQSFDLNKLCVYPNYNELNSKKSCISAFIQQFK